MSFEIYSFKGSNKFFDGVISFGFTTGENDERSYASTVTLMGTTLFSKDHGPLLIAPSRST